MRTADVRKTAELRQVLRELATAAAERHEDDVSNALGKLVALDVLSAVRTGIHAVDPDSGDVSDIADWQEWVHSRMDSASGRTDIVRMAYAALDSVAALDVPGGGRSL